MVIFIAESLGIKILNNEMVLLLLHFMILETSLLMHIRDDISRSLSIRFGLQIFGIKRLKKTYESDETVNVVLSGVNPEGR